MPATTRPDYFNAYGVNGLGVIPRRGWDAATSNFLAQAAVNPVEGIRYWSRTAPNRLLAYFHTSHEYFAQARTNDLALAFGPGDTNVVAVGDGKDAFGRDVIDADATAALDALWPVIFADYGGLLGFQHLCYDSFCTTGGAPAEIVPGPRGVGVESVQPFDALTCQFADQGGKRVLQQFQGGIPVTLDDRWCKYNGLWTTRDNPYGIPMRAQALTPGLRDVANQRRSDEAFDNAVWPQKWANFPLQLLFDFATKAKEDPENAALFMDPDNPGQTLSPTDWATSMWRQLKDALAEQDHRKTFIKLEGSELGILSGADALDALSEPLKAQRWRLFAALGQLPGMMGETDGGTQAYAVAQYNISRHKLEFVRHLVNAVIEWIGTTHLRLLGKPLRARADVKPMAPLDALQEAQGRALEIDNDLTLYDRGLLDADSIGERLVGHKPVDLKKLDASAGRTTKPTVPGNPPPDPKAIPQDGQQTQ